jgi:hypothetical protein
MKKLLIIISALAALSVATAGQFNEYKNSYLYSAEDISTSHRTITDAYKYNSFHHAGLELGKLDLNKDTFNGTLGLRTISAATSDDEFGSNTFILPSILIGTPDAVFFNIYYAIDPVYKDFSDVKTSSYVSRFGAGFGTQNEDKTFRIGFNLNAFGGGTKSDDTDDKRFLLGVEEVGITVGSKPIDALTLSFAAYANGLFDNLESNNDNLEESFSEVTFPRLTFSATVDEENLPYKTAFSFGYARKNFVYSSQGGGKDFHNIAQGRNPENGTAFEADAIVTDSIRFDWTNIGDIPVTELISLQPALKFGYIHNSNQQMTPGGDNIPMNYGKEVKGYDWKSGSFNFGIGIGASFNKFLAYWLEYGRANQKLELGNSLDQNDIAKNDGYNRFTTGLTFELHNLPNFNYLDGTGKLFFDMSLLVLNENGIYNDFYGSKPFQHLTEPEASTQLYRYQPWNSFANEIKTTEFTLGIRSSFLDEKLRPAFNIGFLNQTHTIINENGSSKFGGVNLNFDIVVAIPGI